MGIDDAPVYFLIPYSEWLNDHPKSPSEYWEWYLEKMLWIATLPPHRRTYGGPISWNIQTYCQLRSSPIDVRLTTSIPNSGIIISHGDYLPREIHGSPYRYIVEIKPDRDIQCWSSNMYIVQNQRDPLTSIALKPFFKTAVMEYWSQPDLKPRKKERGSIVRNIAFVGYEGQSSPPSQEFQKEIGSMDMQWIQPGMNQWNNYEEIDAVVAIRPRLRKAERSCQPYNDERRKPASKLINSWLAGVPALLSPDSAYEDLRKTELDYIRVTTYHEVLSWLRILKDNSHMYQKIIANGINRAKEHSPHLVRDKWIRLLTKTIIPAYALRVRSALLTTPIQRGMQSPRSRRCIAHYMAR